MELHEKTSNDFVTGLYDSLLPIQQAFSDFLRILDVLHVTYKLQNCKSRKQSADHSAVVHQIN